MTTILQAMRARALAEFDDLAAEREREIRTELAAAGHAAADIDRVIEASRPELLAQRATVAALVALKLLESGVPLEADAHVWN